MESHENVQNSTFLVHAAILAARTAIAVWLRRTDGCTRPLRKRN
jgi:hypothetical protein